MHATLVDVFLHNGYKVWLKAEDNTNIFLHDSYKPVIYVSDIPLAALKTALRNHGISSSITTKRTIIGENKAVLGIKVQPERVRALVRDLERRYPEAKLYHADLQAEQYYLFAKKLTPLCKVEVHEHEGEIVHIERIGGGDTTLKETDLSFETSYSLYKDFDCEMTSLQIDEGVKGGTEKHILEQLQEHLCHQDPDILLLRDSNITLPYLSYRAKKHDMILKLSRFPQDILFHEGKSHYSYGKTVYRPRSVLLKGRLNMDQGSFLYKEAGFAGVAELASLCKSSIQRLGMRSPGAGISSLQAWQAFQDGILIPYKENLVEKFKSAKTLFAADRGGLIYEPAAGIHGNVAEIDYVSMYPTIMVVNNLSPETVLCNCCKEHITVPELNYNVCHRRGLIPKMLGEVLIRRAYYKKHPTPENKAKAVALKWLLVTSFGYMGFRKSKFGRIEAHEAINAFARDKLLTAIKIAEKGGYKVMHGIIDSLWIQKQGIRLEKVEELCELISKYTGIDIALEGMYRWVVFLPSILDDRIPVPTRYYGLFHDGTMKLRGIAIRRSSAPKIVVDMQREMLDYLSTCNTPKEFLAEYRNAVKLIRTYARKLDEENIEDVIIRIGISKLEYKANCAQKEVVSKLLEEGIALHPGVSVAYVITRGGYAPAEFFRGSINKARYLELLVRAAYELFQPFLSEDDVWEALHGEKQAVLEAFI
ncbi:MAG: DNA polymerase domain-containing protein [Nanoarchaeota archaeon]